MAWTKVFEEELSYAYRESFGGMFSDFEIDENLYNQLSEVTSVKLSIEGRDPVVLPLAVPSPAPTITLFGESDNTGPKFDTYDSCLFMNRVTVTSDEEFTGEEIRLLLNVIFNAEIMEESGGRNTIIEIGEGDPTPTPTPKKTSKVLGVKEAMQHYVSTLDAVAAPATTIKKLTKQALDPDGNNESIQKARTIAEIWEAAAIEGGYKPPVEGAAVVGQAVVGQAVVTSEGDPTPEPSSNQPLPFPTK